MAQVFSDKQIQEFVAAWFWALDQHSPLEEVCSFLAETDLEIMFPEKRLQTLNDFAVGYAGGEYSDGNKAPGVINIFFDEVHKFVKMESKINGDQAELDLIAAWTTLWIQAHKPTAKHIALDSIHKWRVRVSNKNAYGLGTVSYNITL